MFSTVFIDISLIFVQLGLGNFGKIVRTLHFTRVSFMSALHNIAVRNYFLNTKRLNTKLIYAQALSLTCSTRWHDLITIERSTNSVTQGGIPLEASVRVKSFYPFLILSFHSWHFDSSRPYHGIKVLWWWIIWYGGVYVASSHSALNFAMIQFSCSTLSRSHIRSSLH